MASSFLARMAHNSPGWMLAWDKLDTETARRLVRAGLGEPLIWAGIRGDRDGVELMLESVGALADRERDMIDTIIDLCLGLQAAAKRVGTAWAEQQAGISETQLSLDVAIAKRAKTEESQVEKLVKLGASMAQSKPIEWRSKRYRRAVEIGDEKARRRADDAERRKWAGKIYDVIVGAGLPFGLEAKAKGWTCDSPEVGRILSGLRSATLRKRYADIQPFLRWLKGFYGLNFPAENFQVLKYFGVRSEEQAARTVYISLLLSLRFFENAGDVAEADKLGRRSALESAAKELELKRRKAGEMAGEKQASKQAPPMLVCMTAAMERDVGDLDLPMFVRAYAWYRLVRHWTAMRFSDGDYLAPESLVRRARGMVGVLTRTKTSGIDKAMVHLPIFVSQDVWITEPWLDIGLELWQKKLCSARDYFLPLPSGDFNGFQNRRARYTDAQCFSKALMSALKGPEGDRLLVNEAVGFWSEHSDRSGLVSWLGALGVPEEFRKFVGRWATKGSADTYVRTALRVVESCQKLATKHARAMYSGGPDFFGEEETLEKLGVYRSLWGCWRGGGSTNPTIDNGGHSA